MKWIAGQSPTSYQGGGLTVLHNHLSGKYELSFAFGYLEFDNLTQLAEWLLQNDIESFAESKTTPEDIQAFHEARAAQAAAYIQPTQPKLKNTADPTALLKKLGLV